MSGFIREALPTRYEVRREPFPPHYYKDLKSAKRGRKLLSEWKVESGPAKLVTIRRWQVKRTEVESYETAMSTPRSPRVG